MSDLVAPSGPWQAGVREFTMDFRAGGRSNIGWGAVTTHDQVMAGQVRLNSYKLESPQSSNDYYSVFGHMSHGVEHNNKDYQPYHPSPNWVSVGYYATDMGLSLELLGTEGLIWEAGPTSTVGSHTTSFSIGASLSGTAGDFDTISGGVSSSFGASFSSPDVTIGNSVVGHHVRWDLGLPGVGFVSPAVPANPKEPSYAGYKWVFGVIFQVPKDCPLRLRVHPSVHWRFDYTRGTKNDAKTWSEDAEFHHVDSSA